MSEKDQSDIEELEECAVCHDTGEIETMDRQTVGCPACMEREHGARIAHLSAAHAALVQELKDDAALLISLKSEVQRLRAANAALVENLEEVLTWDDHPVLRGNNGWHGMTLKIRDTIAQPKEGA